MAEDKKNYCDKDAQCVATCGEEAAACRYYVPLKTMCPGMCTHLSKLGDHCLSPDAMLAKGKELKNMCHSPAPTGESSQEKRNE